MANSWNGPQLGSPIRTDVPELQKKLIALLKGDPTSVADIPSGAKRLVNTSGVQWQVQQYNGSSWAAIGKLMHDVDKLDGYHAAITPAASTIAVRNADKKLEGDITGNAATASSAATLSETLPVNKGGTGATTYEAARSNLGVPPTSHASTNTTHGVGNSTQYGHLKLSDATDSLSGAAGGIAATPAAVKAAKGAADAAQNSADAAMTKASTLATSSTPGIVKPGTGMSVDSSGALNVVAEQTGCLPLTGGTMTGIITTTSIVALNKSDNNSSIQINGGTSWENGASINLSSKNSEGNLCGSFILHAKDASAESNLIGFPNGSLTWCDSQVFLPVGAVFAFAGNANPSGCIICNGAAVSRMTYAKLFAAIGTIYGAGDGSTTFNLPNLTDRFIQGSEAAGTYIAPGLPGIHGDFALISMHDNNTNNTESFLIKASYGPYTYGGTVFDSPLFANQTNFDAARSSIIYGASMTVQPPALTMRYYIKY